MNTGDLLSIKLSFPFTLFINLVCGIFSEAKSKSPFHLSWLSSTKLRINLTNGHRSNGLIFPFVNLRPVFRWDSISTSDRLGPTVSFAYESPSDSQKTDGLWTIFNNHCGIRTGSSAVSRPRHQISCTVWNVMMLSPRFDPGRASALCFHAPLKILQRGVKVRDGSGALLRINIT